MNKHWENIHKSPGCNVLPAPNGLVLAGGVSSRMGLDKGLINWHGKEQRYHLADLLNVCCADVFISCRPDQTAQMDENYQCLEDIHPDLGPLGAMLSAFNYRSDRAWLVVACDMPLIDLKSLGDLVGSRNAATAAVAFASPSNGLPEPLFAVWEPSAYPALESYYAKGCLSPRRILMDMEITLVKTSFGNLLTNVNTPEQARKLILKP